MRIFGAINFKGGVGKSSVVTNIAGIYAQRGRKVLIVDADPQGNALLTFGYNPDDLENTLYEVITEGIHPKEAIINVHENIDVLGSNTDMAFLDFAVINNPIYPNPYTLFREVFQKIENDCEYDLILADGPPTTGIPFGNLLAGCTDLIIPFEPDYYNMRSLLKMLEFIENFKDKHNSNLKILGVLATKVNQRTTLHSEVLQQCRKFCLENGIPMFETVIPLSIRFATSVTYSKLPAVLTDKNNELVSSYFEVEREIKELIGVEK